jgi:hypothetical protein
MQGIFNSIPEADHAYRVHNVASILLLQFLVHVILFSMLKTLYFTLVHSEVMFTMPYRAVFYN